jgi:hypothetical protein
VRIALNAIGEVGVRTGRILTAERDLVALGIYGDTAGLSEDRRTISIRSLDGYDVLVSDDTEAADGLAAIAATDGIGFVSPGGVSPDVAGRFTDAPLLVDASLAGLAETLSVHEATRTDEPIDAVIAWTEEGKPLRRGAPVAFPDPVGARWGRRLGPAARTTRVAVPVDGEWGGATATVVGRVGSETHTRIVGVADHRAHLEALALAAGAVTAARTDLPGLIRPGDVAEAYLEAALQMGLGVAVYQLD